MVNVSVVIPTYNEEKDILSCLDSLSEQTFKDFEIIVVDDGSTDTTLSLLNGVEEKYKLKVFTQKHKGAGAARNLGVKHTKGKILIFVDSDMTFDPKFLQKLIEPIEQDKAKGTFSREEYVSNWDNVWAKCWNFNNNLFTKRRLPDDYPDHQKVFRAILKIEFEKVSGFDEKAGYTDDWTLSDKLGYEAVAVPDAIFYHKNPETLGEVFAQARWVGKRSYKLGIIGVLVALLRSSLPVSILIGLYKSIHNSELRFVFFKLVYDFGIFIGIFEMIATGKTSK